VCLDGVAPNCNDGNACTSDECVDTVLGRPGRPGTGGAPGTPGEYGEGECRHEFICGCRVDADCADGDACTTDTCNIGTGACEHGPVDCSDGDVCTTDSCDSLLGCRHVPTVGCCHADADCHETPTDNPCTTDSCNLGTGVCYHGNVVAGTPCPSDGNACTNDVCDGAGTCGTPVVCNDGNECTTDSCNRVTGCVYTPRWADCCTSAAQCDDGNSCTNDTCSGGPGAPGTCGHSAVSAPPNDTCSAPQAVSVGGSHAVSTMCANSNYGSAVCGGGSGAARDVTYSFNFTTGTDYQLYHYLVTAQPGGGSPAHPDPFVFARSQCDPAGGQEWRCNADCSDGAYTGTNYSWAGCGGSQSAAVVINPTPVNEPLSVAVITDGDDATARGWVTTAVARENHNNNSCFGTNAYHASPDMFPGVQPAAPRNALWRGNNSGYSDLGLIPTGGSCGAAPTREATWRVRTSATPRIHFYYDELETLLLGRTPFDGVIQLRGPDASTTNCTDAGSAGCSTYLGRGPASIVLDQSGSTREYWVVLGSADGSQGDYNLRALLAQNQFAGQDQWFDPLTDTGCFPGGWPPACWVPLCFNNNDTFDLDCYRIDFVPTTAVAPRGHSYTVAALPGGCNFPVNPGGVANQVLRESWDLPWLVDDCSINLPIGFNFLWGERFYTRMIVSTNGWIRLTNDQTLCNQACGSQPTACKDYSADRNELYTSYQPMIAPLWVDLWGVPLIDLGTVTHQIAPAVAPTGESITAHIITWQDWIPYIGYGLANFQAILYIDGRFSFIYKSLNGLCVPSPSVTPSGRRGIVGASGTSGVVGTAVNYR
jgi:hypothetical protein